MAGWWILTILNIKVFVSYLDKKDLIEHKVYIYNTTYKLENSQRTEWMESLEGHQPAPKVYSVHYFTTIAVIQLQSSKGWMEERGRMNYFTGKVSK